MHDLNTPLGTYWVDDVSPADARVGVREVERVDNWGPDSTFRWSADQEGALFQAAAEVGATLDLLVPGGWRVLPGTALPALLPVLARIAAAWAPTGRQTPAR